jgi:hypothetical protein
MAAMLLCGCPRIVPVVGPPWVEDRTLALAAEELRLAVGADDVAVEAVFHFRAVDELPDPVVMTFPVAAPGGPAREFAAAWVRDDGAIVPIECRPADPGVLPAGDARETWDVLVPGDAFRRGDMVLRITYAQPVADEFSYVLLTGAYWRGPLGRLEVRVTDPLGRVSGAEVEGEPPHDVAGTTLSWTFVDVEPSAGVRLRLLHRGPDGHGDSTFHVRSTGTF